jgi:hypothetical protein
VAWCRLYQAKDFELALEAYTQAVRHCPYQMPTQPPRPPRRPLDEDDTAEEGEKKKSEESEEEPPQPFSEFKEELVGRGCAVMKPPVVTPHTAGLDRRCSLATGRLAW